MIEFENITSSESEIPDYCISFSEMSDYVAEYSIESLYRTLENIGLKEFTIFESTNSSIIYEGKELSELKEKFNTNLKALWAIRKEFWDRAINELDQMVKNDKKMYKLENDALRYLNDTKVYGKTHTFYKPADIKFSINVDKFTKEISKTYKGIKDVNSNNIKKAKQMLTSHICYSVSGVGSESSKDMSKGLKEKLLGSTVVANGSWIKKNSNAILDELNGKCVDRAKAYCSQEMKMFAEVAKQIDYIDNSSSQVASQWNSTLVTTLNMMNKCYAILLDIEKRRYREYFLTVRKIAKPVNK